MTFTKTFAALSVVSATLASAVVFWILGVHDVAQIAMQTGVFLFLAACVHGAMAWYRRSLLKRMEETNTKVWAIQINGVQVDVITDRAYAALQRQLYADDRLMLAQGINLVHIAARLVWFVAVLVPLLGFWVLVAGTLLADPDVLRTILTHTNLGVVHEMLTLLIWSVGFLAIARCVYSPSDFGLRHVYREAACDQLRRFAKSAADGEVRMVPTAAVDTNKASRKDPLSLAS